MAKPDVPRITYVQKQDGHYDIIIANPEASGLRIQNYHEHIQKAVQKDFYQTLTPDERGKLCSAMIIGEPAYTAVWDDLLSRRADQLLRNPNAPLPGTLENGRHELTAHHHPSYHEAELDR